MGADRNIFDFSGLKPGDKIPLDVLSRRVDPKREPKKEQVTVSIEALQKTVEKFAAKTNQMAERFGLTGLLENDGSIAMDAYTEENGGPYTQKEITQDQQTVYEKELEFAGALYEPNPEVQKHMVANLNKEKLKQTGSKAELMITIILHRLLGDDLIVARTVKFDDYKRGVDYIVIHPTTGETICAFDGVVENESDKGKFSVKNTDKKREVAKDITRNGGANLRYGIESKGGKLVRTPLSNMPVFYLSISDKDLVSLAASADMVPDAPITADEIKIFSQFIASLEKQIADLLALNIRRGEPVRDKILDFDQTIEILRNILNNKIKSQFVAKALQ